MFENLDSAKKRILILFVEELYTTAHLCNWTVFHEHLCKVLDLMGWMLEIFYNPQEKNMWTVTIYNEENITLFATTNVNLNDAFYVLANKFKEEL